jgi:hypothetical protein
MPVVHYRHDCCGVCEWKRNIICWWFILGDAYLNNAMVNTNFISVQLSGHKSRKGQDRRETCSLLNFNLWESRDYCFITLRLSWWKARVFCICSLPLDAFWLQERSAWLMERFRVMKIIIYAYNLSKIIYSHVYENERRRGGGLKLRIITTDPYHFKCFTGCDLISKSISRNKLDWDQMKWGILSPHCSVDAIYFSSFVIITLHHFFCFYISF